VKKDFGVAVRAKHEAFRLELAPQLAIVVDLAVERDPVAAVGGRHRLRAGLREIDDGKSAMRKSDSPIVGEPCPGAIGTATRHLLANAIELLLVDGRRRIAVGVDSGDAAHVRYARASARPSIASK
jgi:hypothetical protein